jgi:hypothetical protein
MKNFCVCPKAESCRATLRGCEHSVLHVERLGCHFELSGTTWSNISCPNCADVTGVVVVESEVCLDEQA